MNLDENVTSADSAFWEEVANSLRLSLSKRLPGVIDMTPGEVRAFAEACQDVLTLEIRAKAYDNLLEKSQNRFGE